MTKQNTLDLLEKYRLSSERTAQGTTIIKLTPTESAPTPPTPNQSVSLTELQQKYKDKELSQSVEQPSPSPSPSPLTTLAKIQLEREAAKLGLNLPPVANSIPVLAPIVDGRVEKHLITFDKLNKEQRLCITFVKQGKSFVLIGSAGSGKSTTQRITIEQLVECGLIRPRPTGPDYKHKHLPQGCMSVAICSLMNKAVNNIRDIVPDIVKPCTLTIHKTIEYAPVPYERETVNEHGITEVVKSIRFEPMRNAGNPVRGLTHIIVEEASTVSIELFDELLDALPNRGRDIVFIFLGDLKQLPPVFGQSILTKKLRELEYVELTQIYRQGKDSPIKSFATAINDGMKISDEQLRSDYAVPNQLVFSNLSAKRKDGSVIPRKSGRVLVEGLANHFIKLLKQEEFVPFRDVILCPHRVNKRNDINCEHLNNLIADAHGKHRGEQVFEIRHSWQLSYLAVGDPVLYKKEEYEIISIKPNHQYHGIPVRPAHETLGRNGNYDKSANVDQAELDLLSDQQIQTTDEILNMIVPATELAESDQLAKQASSHIVTIKYITIDPSQEHTKELSSSGEIAEIDFAYCLTVHKSIGSEWDKVWVIAHHSMMKMLSRELLYTACTRAKHYLEVFYDGHNHAKPGINTSTINKAITSPQIKGITVEEKLVWLEQQELIKAKGSQVLLEKYM